MVQPRYDSDASTPETRRALHEQNRLSWNEATRAHNSHKADQAKFFREGGQKLGKPEIDLLGDLRGKSVLHLQCNAGQDTLSIKQLGAAKVAGVDISDEAIDFARKLSADSGVDATFHRADVYDWLEQAAQRDERFDIVYLLLRRHYLAIRPRHMGEGAHCAAEAGRAASSQLSSIRSR